MCRKALFLLAGLLATKFCLIGGTTDFIPVLQDSHNCSIDFSKLPDTCGDEKTRAIHCVQDEEGQLGLCCAEKLWIPKGYCPFFSKFHGVLDYRPCFADANTCPNDRDWYMSNEVYTYPGCLSNNFLIEKSTHLTHTTVEMPIRAPKSCYDIRKFSVFFLLACVITQIFCIIAFKSAGKRWIAYKERRVRREFSSWPKSRIPFAAINYHLIPREKPHILSEKLFNHPINVGLASKYDSENNSI